MQGGKLGRSNFRKEYDSEGERKACIGRVMRKEEKKA
jgi:hypothetical protein